MTASDELHLRLRQQEILAELGAVALRGGDVNSLFQEATRLVALGLETVFCKVLRYLPEEDQFVVWAGVGWRDGVVGHARIGADLASPAGFALKTGAAVITNSLERENRFETPQLLVDHGIQRAINVIIRGDGAPFGVLEADSRHDGAFEPRDLSFMQGAANVLGVALDRMRTEHALADAHARNTDILESISDAFYAVDAAWRFTYVNRRAESWFGRTRAELLGKVYWEEFPQVMGSDVQTAHRTAARDRQPVRLETISPILNHWIDLTVFPTDNGLSVYFRDISDRKASETALKRFTETLEMRVLERTAALEAANTRLVAEIAERKRAEAALMQAQRLEAIGQLTGGIAHDFNNLLTAVIGNLELLLPRQASERTRQQAEAALQAAHRGGELTRQLLAYARKQHVELQPVDANRVVLGMMDLLKRSLGGLVAVETTLADGLWPAISDPAQLEAILLNLAINARDAMPSGGRLRIITGHAKPGDGDLPADLPAGDYIRIAVEDEGAGMAPEVQAKAFEPFFTTKDIGKGSGLGLAQVHGAALQFGGTVRLRSTPDQGTTVEVFLPRAPHAAPGPQPPSPVAADRAAVAGVTVLVVDDQDDVRAVAVAFLEDAGYRVLEASSGPAGLAVLAAEPAALALVDHGMAGMSGVQFVRQARAIRAGLPVIYVTGHADPLGAEGADQSDPILSKPYSPEALLAAISHALKA